MTDNEKYVVYVYTRSIFFYTFDVEEYRVLVTTSIRYDRLIRDAVWLEEKGKPDLAVEYRKAAEILFSIMQSIGKQVTE